MGRLPDSMADVICSICNVPDGEVEKFWICCDKCDLWFHGVCQDVTKTDVRSSSPCVSCVCVRTPPSRVVTRHRAHRDTVRWRDGQCTALPIATASFGAHLVRGTAAVAPGLARVARARQAKKILKFYCVQCFEKDGV